MEELRYQSWSLGRQLNALYETLQQICGVPVAASMNIDTNRDLGPSLAKDPAEQMTLQGLRKQDAILRQQIRDLVAKLPIRRPYQLDETASSNGTVAECVVAPAAEALRQFLVSNGGETGGWDPRDHGLFLQWRSRFRNNRQTFVSAVCDTVPGKNAAQVEAHEKWYQNLQRLRREQRQELDEWKRRKRMQDEEERKRIAEESQQDPNGDTWVAEWRRQRPNVRQQLERWKEQKKAKAMEPEETMESMEAARKKSQCEQRRRMDHQYQKLVAYLWRMEQEAAKMATESADHFLARLARKQKSQSNNTQLMAEQWQERDREWLQQRRRQLLTRQQQQQSKTTQRRRSVSVPRDPQRLMRPTSAFIARLLPADDGPSPQRRRDSSTSYILDVQSRTVPSWRQLSSAS